MIRSLSVARFVRLLLIVCFSGALWGSCPSARGAELSDDELWAGAEARIEKHRKADATITVVDTAGRPVPGAKVIVEQTRHAFLFGCNIFKWGKLPDEKTEAAYRKHYADLLNFATLPFYWPMYEGEQGKPNHEYTGQLARWCKERGIATKGHPLAWNFSDPSWLPDDLDEIRRLQMARIDDCVSHFAGLIDRWDVVNEATHFDREEFAKRRAPKHTAMWAKAGRMEFTRECFVHARKSGPGATLLINDYRTDPAYERVIEKLVDDNGRRMYDVIGIQSHMHGGAWPNRKIWDVCEQYARFGVPLHFTEATIVSGPRVCGGPWLTTAEGEARQAREVVRFYTMLFSHPAVEAITWWDFSDYHAWQRAPAGLIGKDMTPKPAYRELMKRIKGQWWTSLVLETDDEGTAKFRGFLGDYRVTVTARGGKPAVGIFQLTKGEDAVWQVRMKR